MFGGRTKSQDSKITFEDCGPDGCALPANIHIPRSDGICQDISAVASKISLNDIVADAAVDAAVAEIEQQQHDHGKILVNRSDGVVFDLNRVMKTSSTGGEDSNVESRRGSSLKEIDLAKFYSATELSLNRTNSGFFPKTVRIVHFSDTNDFLNESIQNTLLPHGDIMVHSGNFTANGSDHEFATFNKWLKSVGETYHYRLVCFGKNEMKTFGNDYDLMAKKLPNATHILTKKEVVVLGIRFFGCTLSPPPAPSNAKECEQIPKDVHVLVSNIPSLDRLDKVMLTTGKKSHVGSPHLQKAIQERRPQVHLHGHNPEERGIIQATKSTPLSVNSCMCTADRTVMYAAPHVIKAVQLDGTSKSMNINSASPSSSDKSGAWHFHLDFLV